jgi:hypothetical protein
MKTTAATPRDSDAERLLRLATETVSVTAAAHLEGVRPDSIRARVRRGKLSAVKVGRAVRIPVIALRRQ